VLGQDIPLGAADFSDRRSDTRYQRRFYNAISTDIHPVPPGGGGGAAGEGEGCWRESPFRRKLRVLDGVLAPLRRNRFLTETEREGGGRGTVISAEHRFGTWPKERTLISRDTERACICKSNARARSRAENVGSTLSFRHDGRKFRADREHIPFRYYASYGNDAS